MSEQVIQCLVCAWRERCQKKYSVQPSPSFRCPDFERDRTIKPEGPAEPQGKDKGGPAR